MCFLAHAAQAGPSRLHGTGASVAHVHTDRASERDMTNAVLLEPALADVLPLRERRQRAHRGSRHQLAKFPLYGDPGWTQFSQFDSGTGPKGLSGVSPSRARVCCRVSILTVYLFPSSV